MSTLKNFRRFWKHKENNPCDCQPLAIDWKPCSMIDTVYDLDDTDHYAKCRMCPIKWYDEYDFSCSSHMKCLMSLTQELWELECQNWNEDVTSEIEGLKMEIIQIVRKILSRPVRDDWKQHPDWREINV